MHILIYIALCITIAFVRAEAEYFSATTEINRALQVGKQLASDLLVYVDLEQTRLERIRKVAQRLALDGTTPELLNSPEDFFSNPVNAYLTVRRLAVNWKTDLLSLLDSPKEVDDDKSLSVDKHELAKLRARVEESAPLLPGDSDLSGAAEALLRLQDTYKLDADDIANGKLVTDLKSPRMTAAQCVHLGQQAYESNNFLRAEEWFRVAYKRLWEELVGAEQTGEEGIIVNTTDPQEYTLSIPDEAQPSATYILDYLAYALGRQGRYAEALNITRLILDQDPENKRIMENERFYVTRIQEGEGIIGPAPKSQKLSKLDLETETYQAICRGDQIFPPPPADSVYCRYYVPHPYYKIGPVKEEILYPDPKVIIWHDVIHPDEIKHVQELALPRLRRATVKNPVTGKLEFAFYRTSKSAWLSYDLDDITRRLRLRIKSLTGLSLETAEDLQVGNYGIGGYYAPHFDFGRKREKDAFEVENGNRIATLMFYLTDVIAGGATVFNRIGTSITPVRGAAAFWYNLFPSGEGDLRTRHVACPVLVGSKWVMNVWFHERGQELIRPCGTHPDPLEIDDGF